MCAFAEGVCGRTVVLGVLVLQRVLVGVDVSGVSEGGLPWSWVLGLLFVMNLVRGLMRRCCICFEFVSVAVCIDFGGTAHNFRLVFRLGRCFRL